MLVHGDNVEAGLTFLAPPSTEQKVTSVLRVALESRVLPIQPLQESNQQTSSGIVHQIQGEPTQRLPLG